MSTIDIPYPKWYTYSEVPTMTQSTLTKHQKENNKMTTQEIYKSIPSKSWKWEENAVSKRLLGIVNDKKYCLAYVPRIGRITTSIVIYSPEAYPKEYTMYNREMDDASDMNSRGAFLVYHFEHSLPLSIINSIVRLTLSKQLGR